MNIQKAVDIFYNNKDLPGSLQALYSIGKLWDLEDNPFDCFKNRRDAVILAKYQHEVWLYCKANNIDPFESYPKELIE